MFTSINDVAQTKHNNERSVKRGLKPKKHIAERSETKALAFLLRLIRKRSTWPSEARPCSSIFAQIWTEIEAKMKPIAEWSEAINYQQAFFFVQDQRLIRDLTKSVSHWKKFVIWNFFSSFFSSNFLLQNILKMLTLKKKINIKQALKHSFSINFFKIKK